MAKPDSRNYSAEDIAKMIERGGPPAADVPSIDLNDDFWRALEQPSGRTSDGVEIHLRIKKSTVDYFDTTGEDASEMVRVLDAYAAAMTKKAAE